MAFSACGLSESITIPSSRSVRPCPSHTFTGVVYPMANIGAGGVMEISVARDKIAFNLGIPEG